MVNSRNDDSRVASLSGEAVCAWRLWRGIELPRRLVRGHEQHPLTWSIPKKQPKVAWVRGKRRDGPLTFPFQSGPLIDRSLASLSMTSRLISNAEPLCQCMAHGASTSMLPVLFPAFGVSCCPGSLRQIKLHAVSAQTAFVSACDNALTCSHNLRIDI